MERNGIYILDLQKSLSMLENARKMVRETVARGGRILFVGTKKQAREIIRQAAADCGQFYIDERWLGGMLTNFQTIKKSLDRFRELERMQTDGTYDLVSKKERLRLDKERMKLEKVFNGIKDMDQLPGRGVHRGHQQGEDRRLRGAEAEPPGRRAGGHQLRPGSDLASRFPETMTPFAPSSS